VISIPGGILCAGNLTEDILVWPVDELVVNTTVWVKDIVTSIGGNGANTSFAAAKLGARVRLAGLVGDDEAGAHVIAQLKAAGVDTTFVCRGALATPVTVVIVRSDAGRSFLHRPGASCNAFASPLEFSADLVSGCSHFHLANPFAVPLMRPQAGATIERARAAGLTTSLDTGWDSRGEWMGVIGPCLPRLDLLFLNEEESAKLSGFESACDGARFFHDRGTATVVVKLGARGCLVSYRGSQFEEPAFAIEPVDTTGAGDSFAGAFLAGLRHGLPLVAAARLANAAGALSVQRPGATTGLLSYEETLEWMTQR
jgi:sugar/nucleoside kinase (ribokinase family)